MNLVDLNSLINTIFILVGMSHWNKSECFIEK